MRYRVFACVTALLVAVPLALPGATQGWAPPRTAWGDPDLQGAYSNDNETGIPFERPAEFAGRTLSSITPPELKKLNRTRPEQFNAGVTGDECAGGLRPPTHLI